MRTSYAELVRARAIPRIEIPIIQRDYAQGRSDAARIRDAFLNVLSGAVTGGAPVHLDFVYGEIARDDSGLKLVPLDGQQRLTTLFLLHWYLATRAEIPVNEGVDRLPRLTYETRSSSRFFCRKLTAEHPSPFPDTLRLSDWIRDQNWFVRAWRHDPTIESMLVVLDAIHRSFRETDCRAAWTCLVDPERPAITFDFLPIENLGLSDDLYIKMNSRGKPLTEFESFKAELEDVVKHVSQSRHEALCAKIDNEWADIFWMMRGYDNLIDRSFSKYFAFVNDTLAMRSGVRLPRSVADADVRRAELVFGSQNPNADANLESLFAAFDVWRGMDVGQWFGQVFAIGAHQPGKVTIPSEQEGVNLLNACCKFYKDPRQHGPNFGFPLYKHLLLFAVVRHLEDQTTDFPPRIRMLRNLALNSQNELRQDTLPALLDETAQLVEVGRIPERFNTRQVDEEAEKRALVESRPARKAELERLEDHPLLRGCLAVFDLQADEFESRAAAFAEVFGQPNGAPVTGTKAAMLACGDYSLRNRNWRYQFGSGVEAWRDLLAGADLTKSRPVLEKLLDEVGSAEDGPIHDRLGRVTDRYLQTQETRERFDWRYYLVKYDEMRVGKSGIYAGSSGPMSFSLCMLDKTKMNSKYRDPFLFAVCRRSGIGWESEVRSIMFTGEAKAERWLELTRSGAAMRCVEDGFWLRAPTDAGYRAAFEQILAEHHVEKHEVLGLPILRVPQESTSEGIFDTVDRVKVGASVFADLVGMEPA